MNRNHLRAGFGLALAVMGFACEAVVSAPSVVVDEPSDAAPDNDGSVDPTPPEHSEERLGVHDAALALMVAECSRCHDAEPLNLAAGSLDDFVDRLVGMPSTLEDCAGELLVNPSDVSSSLMLSLTDESQTAATCISRMPLGTDGLESGAHADLRLWVELLVDVYAERQEPTEPIAPPAVQSGEATHDDPLRVLNKTKYLISGSAVTRAELSRATDDQGELVPSEFSAVVNEWLASPEFTEKRWKFFELVLEQ
ncbi:MAG: hypothetical protein AAFQ82_16380, partial [Myxococcota bacterium]